MSDMHPVARILPPEEWEAKTPEFLPLPRDHSIVVVVEDGPGGQVLGRWAALTVVHVEGLSIIPEAQKHPAVAGALLSTMVKALLAMGVIEVLTQAETPDVEGMIQTAGGRQVPGNTWVIPLKDEA